MRVKEKPVLFAEDFKNNPLAGSDFKILVSRYKDGSFVRDHDHSIIKLKEIDLERIEFTKIFKVPDQRKMVSLLTPTAQRLYLWLIYEIDNGIDYLWINVERYMKENNINSVNTYKNAATELCRYLFIAPAAPKYKNVYWINPRLFFAGSRINLYPNNIEYNDQKPK